MYGNYIIDSSHHLLHPRIIEYPLLLPFQRRRHLIRDPNALKAHPDGRLDQTLHGDGGVAEATFGLEIASDLARDGGGAGAWRLRGIIDGDHRNGWKTGDYCKHA